MPIHTFNYTECPVEPCPAFPGGIIAKRPLLRVALINGDSHLSCFALVDSGCDYTLFPLSFMSEINITLSAALPSLGSGIGGQPKMFFHDIVIEIEGLIKASVYAGFTDALDEMGIGTLGQNGFFDRLQHVRFNLLQGEFEIEI